MHAQIMEQNNIKENDCWLFLVKASVSFEGSWNGIEKAQLQLHACSEIHGPQFSNFHRACTKYPAQLCMQ